MRTIIGVLLTLVCVLATILPSTVTPTYAQRDQYGNFHSPVAVTPSVALPAIKQDIQIDGHILWGPVPAVDGRFYLATDRRDLYIIDQDLTMTSVPMPHRANCTGFALGADGTLYLATSDGSLVSVFAKDGGNRWTLSLSQDEPVTHLAVMSDDTILVATQSHVYVVGGQPLFALPMVIVPHPATQKHVLWTWTWTGKKQPQSFLVIVYHYVGKQPIGDVQARVAGSGSMFAAMGLCGETYYLRVRAVGAGFPSTYYAPPDGIAVTCS